jgi:hypothetical protein
VIYTDYHLKYRFQFNRHLMYSLVSLPDLEFRISLGHSFLLSFRIDISFSTSESFWKHEFWLSFRTDTSFSRYDSFRRISAFWSLWYIEESFALIKHNEFSAKKTMILINIFFCVLYLVALPDAVKHWPKCSREIRDFYIKAFWIWYLS